MAEHQAPSASQRVRDGDHVVKYYSQAAVELLDSTSKQGTARPALPNLEGLSFDGLAQSIAKEKALLHPSPNALADSFRAREGVVAYDVKKDEPIGYVRLEPTINDRAISALGLSDSFPRVVEAGSMFVDPSASYRGHGHLARMCQVLFARHGEAIRDGKMLILGTAKNTRVFSALDDIEGRGIKFDAMHHHDLRYLAALTCICSGQFGQGYQFGVDSCSARIDGSNLGNLNLMADLTGRPRGAGCQTACAMFVSSRSLAHEANSELERACGGRIERLIEVLRDSGFYGPNATTPESSSNGMIVPCSSSNPTSKPLQN